MTRRASCLAGLAAAIVVTSSLVATRNAGAEIIFTVNSLLDQPDDLTTPGTCHTAAGTCTLRAAVMQANRSTGAGAKILLPAGLYSLTIPATGNGGEENGDLNLTPPVSGNPVITLMGAGASTTIIDANQLFDIFSIDVGRTVVLAGVTLRNGYADFGGAIDNFGALTVTRSTITGSEGESGGGINNVSTLTVSESTISANHGNFGGGINNLGTLTVIQSTISANHGNFGGGIFNDLTMRVVDSTISENDADSDGGGIYNGGAYSASTIANVYNTTIVFNGADSDRDEIYGGSGGGVYSEPMATFNLRNTLVAGNVVENLPVPDDCTGTLFSYGRNLIGVQGEPAPCTISNGSGSWAPLNSTALIDILRSNGGPTQTHALLPGSNAIDGGDPTFGCTDYNGNPIATDQRGAPRVAGVRCDIGAFEVPEPASMAAAAAAIATLASMRRRA